jgi:two-component system response regulator HydG
VTCQDPHRIPSLMAEREFHAIMLDMNFRPGDNSGEEGLRWLNGILEMDRNAVVIMVTAFSSVDAAVEAMKLGAHDFIEKPWNNERLISTLSVAVRLRRSREEAQQFKQQNRILAEDISRRHHPIIGQSEAINQMLSIIRKAGPTDANVLILGENGTGKELVARGIHHHSSRNKQPFVPVDCASMSETVIESELFGHAKGAYTGADSETVGLIRSAHMGILFMDEIGELSLNAQAKLLRTLQERTVRPVGSTAIYEVDIQIIAATNRNLVEEVESGNFRQDLYYRLNAVTLSVPPLQERKGDIDLLANHFLSIFSSPENAGISISDRAIELMNRHNWPGNVRELENVIRGALVFADEKILTPEDLPGVFSQYLTENDSDSPMGSLADYERSAIKQALIDTGNNRRLAAEILNIAEATLYRKIKKYGL